MSSTLSCYHAVKRTDGSTRPSPAASYINAVFVGDRSGSMGAMGSVPQEGAADFLRKHKELADKNPHSEIIVTVVTFDDYSTIAYHGQAKSIKDSDIEKVKNAMIPRNTTRLIDTAIEEIEKQAHALHLARQRWNDTRARSKIPREVRSLKPSMASSFTLLTDGEDNQSVFMPRDLNLAIKEHQEKFETVCLFAAANQDAMSSGARYGFNRDRSLQIGSDMDEARAAFDSCNAAAVRSATGLDADYTQVEREASCTMDFYGGSGLVDDDMDDDFDTNSYCPVPRATRC